MLTGNIDVANLEKLSGWVQDLSPPDAAVRLQIIDNGVKIGHVIDNHRLDLEQVGIGYGCHTINFEFASGTISSGFHLIRVLQGQDAAEAPSSSLAVKASQTFEVVVQTLTGSVDIVGLNMISGWARDELRRDTAVSLSISLGTTLANSYRDDLRAAGIGNGCVAFEFEFPIPLVAFKIHEIRVMRQTDGAELPGSPVTLRASSSFDKSVEGSLSRTFNHCGAVEAVQPAGRAGLIAKRLVSKKSANPFDRSGRCCMLQTTHK
jgi:hypothetical protein